MNLYHFWIPLIVITFLLLQLKNKYFHASFIHKNSSGQFSSAYFLFWEILNLNLTFAILSQMANINLNLPIGTCFGGVKLSGIWSKSFQIKIFNITFLSIPGIPFCFSSKIHHSRSYCGKDIIPLFEKWNCKCESWCIKSWSFVSR